MAKMGMSFEDRGSMNDSSTPVCENGNGPSSFRHIQWCGESTSGGTLPATQTMESSSGVRVIELNSLSLAHAGTDDSGANRTMAYGPANLRNLRVGRFNFRLPSTLRLRTLPLNRLA